MRTFEIAAGSYKGKQIRVTRYVRTATGMEIKVEHNVTADTGKEVQWIQTFTSNNVFSTVCKQQTIVDPFGFGTPSLHKFSLPAMPGTCKADDLLPFYWTADDLTNGNGPGFSDAPNNPVPAKGRVWTQFTLALTEVSGKNIRHLVEMFWGYDRMADGEVRAAAIRTPTKEEMRAHFNSLKKMFPDFTYSSAP